MSTPDPWGILDELRAARSDVAELRRTVEAMAARDQDEALQPLCKILVCSPRAALGRLEKDPDLRAIGHRLGRRLVFRASEVRHVLAERQRVRASR